MRNRIIAIVFFISVLVGYGLLGLVFQSLKDQFDTIGKQILLVLALIAGSWLIIWLLLLIFYGGGNKNK